MQCANPSCQKANKSGKISKITSCPHCKQAIYCSIFCRKIHWQSAHKIKCKGQNKYSAFDYHSKASSTKSLKKQLSDYEFVQGENEKSYLGKGSYGSVRLMREKSSGKYYAIKIISKRQIYEFKTQDVLKREIKIQRKMDHPHICKLYHCFEDSKNVYMVLEYAEHGSLFHYVQKRGKLSEQEAFVYFFQTCLGIDYLH